LTPEQDLRLREKMQAIVATPLNGATSELVFAAKSYPPMSPTDANQALLASLNDVNADLGLETQPAFDPAKRGAADISFIADRVDAALAGMGAAGSGAHGPDEQVDLNSISRQAKRTAVLLTRLSRR
ncbi:MAG: M20/M25/M40 family metallo-hydrolase, partial [Pacificimonas sp.]